ncbi:MAG: TRAP transporter substrate-binding protein [Betaproteobacteria bacterium]|nr:TRAP transporter substrate-binding protein [Betaproteobacteria bacterium]
MPTKILSACLLLCAFTATHARSQSIELRFAAPAPAQSPIVSRGIADWTKLVAADSGNTVTFRVMAGPTLATFENVYDRVLKGVADIGFGTAGTVAGQFRRSEVATLPFEAEGPVEVAVTLWRSAQRGLVAEDYAAVKPLALFSFPNSLFHMRNARIREIADIKGKKIGTGGRMNGDIIAKLGAAPITLAPPEVYMALSSGLIDGVMIAWTAVDSFKLHEVAKNHFTVPLSSTTAYVVMNKASFDRLPPQARAAIEKHSGEAFSRRMGNVVESLDNAAKYSVRNMPGHNFDESPAAELQLWRKQLEAIPAAWVKGTPNGTVILAGYREEVKKFRSGR